jgi:hypothetical protein
LKGRLSIFDSISIITKHFPVIKRLNAVDSLVVIDNEKNAERFKFFENFARRRGYNVRVFSDPKLASKWIRKTELAKA